MASRVWIRRQHQFGRWQRAPSVSLRTPATAQILITSSMVVQYSDEACIRYLLERGADPNLGAPMHATAPTALMRAITDCGWTLNRVAAFCTPEIFTLLLHHGADIRNAIPLHHAAGYGPSSDAPLISSQILMLEYLVSLGLDINALDDADTIPKDGRGRIGTLLAYAVWWRRVDEARWLFERGADPDKTSIYGLSARYWGEILVRGGG
jgi:ankyrin repeat protein